MLQTASLKTGGAAKRKSDWRKRTGEVVDGKQTEEH